MMMVHVDVDDDDDDDCCDDCCRNIGCMSVNDIHFLPFVPIFKMSSTFFNSSAARLA